MGTTCSCNDHVIEDSITNTDQNQNLMIQAKLGNSKIYFKINKKLNILKKNPKKWLNQ